MCVRDYESNDRYILNEVEESIIGDSTKGVLPNVMMKKMNFLIESGAVVKNITLELNGKIAHISSMGRVDWIDDLHG